MELRYSDSFIRRNWFHISCTIDEEKVTLLAETAKEVMGPENVHVLWERYLGCGIDVKTLDSSQRNQLFMKTALDFMVRFTGRSAEKLGPLFQGRSVDEFSGNNCSKSFLSPKGVHIDPHGNVFSGLCSGIIIGNVNESSLKDIWKNFDPGSMPVVSGLIKGSPSELLDEAEGLGFESKDTYVDKCHLCSDIRQFFFDKGRYSSIIGPAECYN